jgi:uncharacterized iron-regulated protein
MAACQGPAAGDPNDPEGMVRGAEPPERIVRLPSGEEVTYEAMLSDLLAARAVFVGEQHDDPAHHGAQYRILRALHEDGGQPVLAVEWFQQPYQAALDDWIDGLLDERVLRERTEYDQRWGYDFRMARPILEYARANAVPLVGMNVPREVSMAVARGGLDALDEELRVYVPADMERDPPRYREFEIDALDGHPGMTPDSREHFFEAQLLWDEAMGHEVARLIEEGAPRVLVFAGRMHVQRGLGIPRTAARRGVSPTRVVLPMTEAEVAAHLEAIAAGSGGTPPLADYVWVLASP